MTTTPPRQAPPNASAAPNAASNWSPAPPHTALPSGQIHVWRTELCPDAATLHRLQAVLSTDELQRADRFHHENSRRAYLTARGTLRLLLARYLDTDPAALRFDYGPHGKPSLSDGPHFNLSHSGDLALIAVSTDRPVGVDIEHLRDRVADTRIARRFFAPDEVEALEAVPPSQRKTTFFRCWTRKEAYLKAHGSGITVALDSFSVTISDQAAITRPSSAAAQWTLHHLDPGTGYTGAVCAPGDWTLHRWHWPPQANQ